MFGLMRCQECGCTRAFVSSDAHVKHITDAQCEHCGFVYGRYDTAPVDRGELQPDGSVKRVMRPARKNLPVISDEVAAEAAKAYRNSFAVPIPDEDTPRPTPAVPDQGEGPDPSRVASYLRNMR